MLEGVLVAQTGTSPVRRRPHHFALLCLGSVVIWCVFDGLNFSNLDSWRYIRGVPVAEAWDRYWGLTTSFATIVPAMLMSGQVFLNLGWFDRAAQPPVADAAVGQVAGAGERRGDGRVGLPQPQPGGQPHTVDQPRLPARSNQPQARPPGHVPRLAERLVRPHPRRLRRRAALRAAVGILELLGGIKWVYHLPFLGPLEHVKYFEMPAVGLLGFIPFGLECWVMWQTMRIPVDGLAEPLPDERSLL